MQTQVDSKVMGNANVLYKILELRNRKEIGKKARESRAKNMQTVTLTVQSVLEL